MKSSYLRAGAALACALSLSACGGGSGERLLLSGTINGLVKEGLILQNNNGSDQVIQKDAKTFSFVIDSDTDYNVTVKSAPSNATCTASNNTGKARSFNVTGIVINCVTTPHKLGGTVSGLTADGLVVVNGKDRQAIPAGATTFEMTPVAEEAPYSIQVLYQPAQGRCEVFNGDGTMGTSDRSGDAGAQIVCS
jgi:hypothetical protein